MSVLARGDKVYLVVTRVGGNWRHFKPLFTPLAVEYCGMVMMQF